MRVGCVSVSLIYVDFVWFANKGIGWWWKCGTDYAKLVRKRDKPISIEALRASTRAANEAEAAAAAAAGRGPGGAPTDAGALGAPGDNGENGNGGGNESSGAMKGEGGDEGGEGVLGW